MGFLDQLLGYGPAQEGGLSPQDRSQAFFAGLGGLGQSLAAAGAPRVGAPGPGLAAGLGGFQPAYQDSRKQLLAAQMQRELMRLREKEGNENRALQRDIAGARNLSAEEIAAKKLAAAAAKPKKSDLFDQTGDLKPTVTTKIQSLVGAALGGTVDETGRVMGLPPPLAKRMPEIVRRAELRIKTKRSDTVGDAVAETMARMELPKQMTLPELGEAMVDIVEKDKEADQPGAVDKLKTADATGVTSGVKDFVLNNVLGQVFPDTVDKNVVAARQQLGLLANDFIVAEKRSPRLPVWEQMRLAKIFTEPTIWRSPEQVRQQLRAFDERLSTTIEQEKLMLETPLSDKEKRESLNNLRQLARFRRRVRKFDLDTVSGGLSVGGTTAEPDPTVPSVTMPIPQPGDADLINKYLPR